MKFELGRTYKTRDGRNARVICVDRKPPEENQAVMVALVSSSNEEISLYYNLDGTISAHMETCFDLMPPAPKMKKIKLYAYFQQLGSNQSQLIWLDTLPFIGTQLTINGFNSIRIPSEDKEIEVEYEE